MDVWPPPKGNLGRSDSQASSPSQASAGAATTTALVTNRTARADSNTQTDQQPPPQGSSQSRPTFLGKVINMPPPDSSSFTQSNSFSSAGSSFVARGVASGPGPQKHQQKQQQQQLNPFSLSCSSGTPTAQSPVGGPPSVNHEGNGQLTVSSIEHAINRLSQLPPDYGNDAISMRDGRQAPRSRQTSLLVPAGSSASGGLQLMLNLDQQLQLESEEQLVQQRCPPLNTSYSMGALGHGQNYEPGGDDGSSSSSLGTSRHSNISAKSAPDRIQLKKKRQEQQLAQSRKRSMDSQTEGVNRIGGFDGIALSRHSMQSRSCATALNRLGGGGSQLPGASSKKNRKLGPLKVTQETYAEVIAYKRSLILLILILCYTLFALGTVIFRSGPAEIQTAERELLQTATLSSSFSSSSDRSDGDEWTQEQIAGWHQDHQLVLSDEYLELFKTAGNIRIRECKPPQQTWISSPESYGHLQQFGESAIEGAGGHGSEIGLRNRQHEVAANRSQQLTFSSISGPSTSTTTTTTTSRPAVNISSQKASFVNVNISTARKSQQHVNQNDSSAQTISTNSTTKRPVPRQKFAALNGCLFRRDTTSDSLGDLCCCSGVPKFIHVNVNVTSTTTNNNPVIKHSVNETTTSTGKTTVKPARAARTTSTKTKTTRNPATGTISTTRKIIPTTSKRPEVLVKKKYLRPHLMCFVSAAGALFNAQKMVAPLVSEYNLKNANLRDKGKCIPCSCCHEHEPEMVNKLLANVPLDKQTVASSNQQQQQQRDYESTGVWVSLREKLVNSMRALDDFLFYIYDMLDLALFSMRFGTYPVDTVHLGGDSQRADATNKQSSLSQQQIAAAHQQQQLVNLNLALNVVPLRAAQQFHSTSEDSLIEDEDYNSKIQVLPQQVGKSAIKLKQAVSSKKMQAKAVRAKEATLLIDADAYDDFKKTTTTTTTSTTTSTTTTTTTTTTSTTLSPSSTTRRGARRRMKKIRKGMRRRNKTSTTTSTSKPDQMASRLGPSSSSSKRPAMEMNKSTSTTTKSPTVIINVYAAGNGALPQSETATKTATTSTTTSTTTRAPKITLIAGQGTSHLSTSSELTSHSGSVSRSSSDFKLQIELRTNNSSTTPAPSSQSFLVAHNTNSGGSLVGGSSATTSWPHHQARLSPRLISVKPLAGSIQEPPADGFTVGAISNKSENVLLTIVSSNVAATRDPPSSSVEVNAASKEASGAGTKMAITTFPLTSTTTTTTTSARPRVSSMAAASAGKSAPSIVISLERGRQPTATITINTTNLVRETISAAPGTTTTITTTEAPTSFPPSPLDSSNGKLVPGSASVTGAPILSGKLTEANERRPIVDSSDRHGAMALRPSPHAISLDATSARAISSTPQRMTATTGTVAQPFGDALPPPPPPLPVMRQLDGGGAARQLDRPQPALVRKAPSDRMNSQPLAASSKAAAKAANVDSERLERWSGVMQDISSAASAFASQFGGGGPLLGAAREPGAFVATNYSFQQSKASGGDDVGQATSLSTTKQLRLPSSLPPPPAVIAGNAIVKTNASQIEQRQLVISGLGANNNNSNIARPSAAAFPATVHHNSPAVLQTIRLALQPSPPERQEQQQQPSQQNNVTIRA